MTGADVPPPAQWRVEIPMPAHFEGRYAGQPVGWQDLNNLPRRAADNIKWDRARKCWRLAAFNALAKAKVPQHLGRIEVTVELRFSRAGDHDPGNYEPTLKPIIDALGQGRRYINPKKKRDGGLVVEVGYRVIPKDTPEHLVRHNPIVGPVLGMKNPVKGMVILHINQLPAGEAVA